MKQKHIPQRTCIACRKIGGKRGLVRLVRTETGGAAVDQTGKRPGRGAYLCSEPLCWEQAVRRQALARALRITALPAADLEVLTQFAAQFAAPAAEATTEDR